MNCSEARRKLNAKCPGEAQSQAQGESLDEPSPVDEA